MQKDKDQYKVKQMQPFLAECAEDHFFQIMQGYNRMMSYYRCALMEIETKFKSP